MSVQCNLDMSVQCGVDSLCVSHLYVDNEQLHHASLVGRVHERVEGRRPLTASRHK